MPKNRERKSLDENEEHQTGDKGGDGGAAYQIGGVLTVQVHQEGNTRNAGR